VTAPDGGEWRVRRLWAPRLQGETLWARAWRKVRRGARRSADLADVPDPGCLVDGLEGLAIALTVLAVVLVVVLVGIPLLLALLDIVLILLLTALGIGARVVFRRPWIVEAVGPDEVRRTWRVVGWRASREAVDDIADALAHGQPPPPADREVVPES
jgi:hypothetical protein